jgi:hypothetical protein
MIRPLARGQLILRAGDENSQNSFILMDVLLFSLIDINIAYWGCFSDYFLLL